MHELRLLSVMALVSPALLSGCVNTHTVKQTNAQTAKPTTPPTTASVTHPTTPTNARSCPTQVLLPAQFQQQTKKELVYQGGFRYENIPATIAWGEKRIQIEPARHVRESVPAKYREETESIEVERERYELRTTPAVYKTETKRVKIKDSYLRWQPGCMGEAKQCAVPVPAQYTFVKRALVSVPASTKRVFIPSKTIQVKRKILVHAGIGTGGIIPAKYKTVNIGRITKPWQIKTTQEANRYDRIDMQKRVRPQTTVIRHAVCNGQLSRQQTLQLQARLQSAGIPVSITGKLDAQTQKGVVTYQEKHRLASGALTFETLKKLGLR